MGNLSARGVTLPAKNYIINGCFEFWQRGTALDILTTRIFLPDRFCFQKGNGFPATVSVSRLTTGLPAESLSRYAVRMSCPSMPSNKLRACSTC